MRQGFPTEDASPGRTSWRVALFAGVGALLVWKLVLPSNESLLDPDARPRTVDARGDLAEDERATIELFERASPSVVYISNLALVQTRPAQVDPRWIRLNPTQIQEGTGSGFLWDDEGHVVTNYHVIHAAQELDVTLASHETFPARVVGHEVEKDIAVLKIDAPRGSLRPIAVGSSADLRVGQKVFAIGNPFGLDQTLTSGIISGLGREIPARFEEEGRGQRPLTDLIQTDAAINRGNSGGPLLDSAGRLIGMNTALVSPSGVSAGVGFAIPVDAINRVVTEILRFGQARRPGLGIRIAPDIVAQAFGVKGLIVSEVLPGTGAARAGLRGEPWSRMGPGAKSDIIVAVNGTAVRTSNDLYRELAQQSVGDRVRLTVLRDRERVEVEVELQDLH